MNRTTWTCVIAGPRGDVWYLVLDVSRYQWQHRTVYFPLECNYIYIYIVWSYVQYMENIIYRNVYTRLCMCNFERFSLNTNLSTVWPFFFIYIKIRMVESEPVVDGKRRQQRMGSAWSLVTGFHWDPCRWMLGVVGGVLKGNGSSWKTLFTVEFQ